MKQSQPPPLEKFQSPEKYLTPSEIILTRLKRKPQDNPPRMGIPYLLKIFNPPEETSILPPEKI